VKYGVSYGNQSTELQIKPGKPVVLNSSLRRIGQ
jgi:hypothetical protein